MNAPVTNLGQPAGHPLTWAAQAFYICIAATLESPLFIAFSILYRDSSLSQVEALSATAIK
jgi:hypothetical protein